MTDVRNRPAATACAADPAFSPQRRRLLGGLAVALVALPAAARAGDAPAPEQPPGAGAAPQPRAFTLRAAPAAVRLRGAETRALAFNGVLPGPLLRLRQGETLALTLENGLDEPLSLHFHGAGAPNALDGVAGLTGPAVAPGERADISFTARHAGVFWYRPMVIGRVSRQTERGLYGMLVVDEPAPPPVAADVAVVIDDWLLDDSDAIAADSDDAASRAGPGRFGNWLTVNAAPPPQALALRPGARARLRILNAANARPLPLKLQGLEAHVMAVDGRPCEPFRPASDQLAMPPGGRFDLIVDAPPEDGAEGALLIALGDGLPVLTVRGEGAPAAPQPPLQPLPPQGLPDDMPLEQAQRRRLVLGGGAGADPARVWTINGKSWPEHAGAPLFRVKSGQTVVLEVQNDTALAQPLHLHGHHARRLHALDDGWSPYWLDVVTAPPGRVTQLAFPAGEPGRWLVGAAAAERLDGGMAAWFEVTA
ncbi:multicopper oxidase family protein [Camelimonas abortus]|uniref:multicopper oxidase family protein n=1 Tax=Camelimonas abortus TaxID=1017184 RepID=UPI0035E78752